MANLIHITTRLDQTEWEHIRQACQAHSIVMSQDGVYNLLCGDITLQCDTYVLVNDANVRGVCLKSYPAATPITYADFVELTLTFDSIIKW